MGRAVCAKCGAARDDFRQLCPACGMRPIGDGLVVAWLLSDQNLDADGLELASARIRRGEPLRPSARMLEKAQQALGSSFGADTGLTSGQRFALLATSFLVTPMVGWVCFAVWRRRRPRAAWQAFGLSAPVSVLYFAIGLWICFGGSC